ncbi:ArsR/SmtB family transcription factor [Lacticaseibacillus hulanensis]|uniref:ArsR/SmtB family transcription factor n=1 Tax=Lacticaseibacillus hulanensis TaxID=2493111 RepID=UPI000FD6EDEF|nr:metalloregulator ArsR/SmtB family transcription factor [Lacticaseibacillus hulanensis]
MKALSDPHRIQIIDLLSCGELCACDILQHFDFSQPTLSHHMKVLQQAGIASSRREGKWQRYSLEPSFVSRFQLAVADLFTDGEQCQCKIKNRSCE